MEETLKFLGNAIYWLIVILPFSIALPPAITSIICGFLIVLFLIKQIIRKEAGFFSAPVLVPLVFLLLITAVSIAHSVCIRDTLKGGIFRLLQYIFLLIVLANEVKDAGQIRKIAVSALAGILFSSIDAVWQVITGSDFVNQYETVVNLGIVRATASFKDPNTFGIYLSAFIPLILGLARYYRRGITKIVFIICGLIGLIGVGLTYSRPALLAVYVSVLFIAFIRKDKFLQVSLLALLLIMPFIAPRSVKDFARSVDYNPLRFMCNDDRIAIFRHSIRMIQAHPVIGVGANTFMKNYKTYKEYPEYRNVITADMLYAHNNFLHMAAEIGLVGLGIFLWFLYCLFKELRKIFNTIKDEYLKIVFISLVACLIAFLVNGLTESSLYSSRVAVSFWYLSGLALAFKHIRNNDPA